MITSRTNDSIKYVRTLKDKKNRDAEGKFIVEGIKMVEEAILEKIDIDKIFICNKLYDESIDLQGYDIEEVDERVFEYISDTVTPQGILAIVSKKGFPDKYGNVVFALDDVQDPGNVGTIIRTLDCAGISDLVVSNASADPYNLKVVRSTMGAIFRVSLHFTNNLLEYLCMMQKNGYKIVATSLDAKVSYADVDYDDGKYIIVIGNESRGISAEIQNIADIKIKIPLIGRTESLNASVAAGIIAYSTLKDRN